MRIGATCKQLYNLKCTVLQTASKYICVRVTFISTDKLSCLVMAQPLAEETPIVVIKSTFKYFDKDNSGYLEKGMFILCYMHIEIIYE